MSRKDLETSTEDITKPSGKKRKTHDNLNPADTLRLWVAAGGRCELCLELLNVSNKTQHEVNLLTPAQVRDER